MDHDYFATQGSVSAKSGSDMGTWNGPQADFSSAESFIERLRDKGLLFSSRECNLNAGNGIIITPSRRENIYWFTNDIGSRCCNEF